jgi:hypothetical protein
VVCYLCRKNIHNVYTGTNDFCGIISGGFCHRFGICIPERQNTAPPTLQRQLSGADRVFIVYRFPVYHERFPEALGFWLVVIHGNKTHFIMRFFQDNIHQQINLVAENQRKQGDKQIIQYFKLLVHWLVKFVSDRFTEEIGLRFQLFKTFSGIKKPLPFDSGFL